MSNPVIPNPWTALRAYTPARIALGRTGTSLPTDEILRFGLAHARARDAVHLPLDRARLECHLSAAGFEVLHVHSRAEDRATYLRRPDLGRRLRADDAQALRERAAAPVDLCFVIADGLSALAVQSHAVPLLQAFRERAGAKWTLSPVVVAEQGRVALGDEIGEILRARLAIILIGERPGLSSPDSLGVYLTFDPRTGRTDAERNCLSNIRPQGLPQGEAAARLDWLVAEAFRRSLTGIHLKDASDSLELPNDVDPGTL